MLTKAPSATHEIRWSLLENGIDFIRAAVEAYFVEDAAPDPAYKYAVLHLHAGCLLLWKERLRREHECLVYQKVDESDGKSAARTVDFDQAMARLKRWAKVELAKEDEETLRKLQSLRNKTEHHLVHLNKHEAQATITQAVQYLYAFLQDQLEERLEEHVSANVWEKVSELRSIAQRIRAERRKAWQTWTARYAALSEDELEALEGEPYHPKHNPDPLSPLDCDECGERSLYLDVHEPTGMAALVCTNADCRNVLEPTWCTNCSSVAIPGGDLCENCQGHLDHLISKDD